MPLHLLGKKSWNVYNADNIARVKADEAAAAAREAADEQRMQALDAERRAAILRGQTPSSLLAHLSDKDPDPKRVRNIDGRGHGWKRRKLAGEDDTDMDIRLARSVAAPGQDGEKDAKVLKLRSTDNDAPLQNHAGNIDLFPVAMKEATRREKNTEVEKEKRNKEKALEDQYTMRFSNAAGRGGIEQPWYAAQQQPSRDPGTGEHLQVYEGFVNKNVWGDEDPRRKERELARISSKDPFAFMQQAQAQLKKSKQDKQQWAEERERELRELRIAQEKGDKRSEHHKRKRREHNGVENDTQDATRSSRHKHRRRSRSRERHGHRSSHRSSRRRSRSTSQDRDRDRHRYQDRRHQGRQTTISR